MDDRSPGEFDRVFVALADSTRRALLDRLYMRDGQRLGELAEAFAISRQAISKHLDVLADAGLVQIERTARGTVHFLDRVPLRAVETQWINKYTRGR